MVDVFADHGLALSKAEADERIEALLASVGLKPSVAKLYPHELSGGMKQRVFIAIAISLRPKVIIADEPTSALDVVVQRQVMETLLRVQERARRGGDPDRPRHGPDGAVRRPARGDVRRKLVEVCPARSMFAEPLNPYSQVLIASLPSLTKKDEFQGIPGLPPSLLDRRRLRLPRALPARIRALRGGGTGLDGTSPGPLGGLSPTRMGGGRSDDSAARSATRHQGLRRGLFDRQRNVALDDFSLTLEDAAVDHGGRRRERQRQDDAGPAAARHHSRPAARSSTRARISRSSPPPSGATFRREVQAIFQDPFEVYNPFYTVDHLLTCRSANSSSPRPSRPGARMMEEALTAVGLRPEETLGRFPHQLTGGQRQRIMVARALLLKPRLIIADEPVSMVDASLRATILESLRQLNQQFGISIIYITHDLTTAYQISENIIVLYRGGVAEAGDVERVVSSPQHPYTQLLVGSVPAARSRPHLGGRTGGLGARQPDDTPTSCRFANRCPSAMANACKRARRSTRPTRIGRRRAIFTRIPR